MAEIKIEKKKPVWPWILLILIILAVIAYFVYMNNEAGNDMDDMYSTEIDSTEYNTSRDTTVYQNDLDTPNSTSTVMQYGESIKDSTRIGTDSTYTKTALQNLAKAVTEKAAQYNLDNSKTLDELKNYSSQINEMNDSKMSNASSISNNLKMVSNNIAAVLQILQTKNFPSLQADVTDLKQTASKITSTAIEKQQTTLQVFFRKASDILNKMNS